MNEQGVFIMLVAFILVSIGILISFIMQTKKLKDLFSQKIAQSQDQENPLDAS